MQQQEKIQNILLSKSGMYDKIFGSLLPKIVFVEEIENRKTQLKACWGFHDIDQIFPSKIDKKRFNDINKVINNYKESNSQLEQQKNE